MAKTLQISHLDCTSVITKWLSDPKALYHILLILHQTNYNLWSDTIWHRNTDRSWGNGYANLLINLDNSYLSGVCGGFKKHCGGYLSGSHRVCQMSESFYMNEWKRKLGQLMLITREQMKKLNAESLLENVSHFVTKPPVY